ncbi:MAG: hypothetical protein JNN30_17445 [Rhodanobacteraceae bacterium]|nr:hypothetical protein [Rhodanobacteraceae bacterium]
MKALLLSLFWIAQAAAGDPCAGVERGIDDAAKTQLAPLIGRHLGVRGVRINEALHSGEWHAFLVGARDADESVVLYSGDPLSTRQIEAIGLFALPEGEKAIRAWFLANHAAMPAALASCVAQLVAKAGVS